jgi:5-methylcytosine-specific restriction endonuclease McrA
MSEFEGFPPPTKNFVCSLCGKSTYPPTRRTNIWREKAYDVCGECTYRIQRTISRHNVRARKVGLIASLTSAQWIYILQQSGGYCHYCKEYEPPIQLTPDHVIPIGKGGANSLENVVAACLFCNIGKQDKSAEEWLEDIRNGYFHQPGATFRRSDGRRVEA